jgi:uncharacterized protein YceK
MKNVLALLALLIVLSGCTSTKITTYDDKGNIIKVEEATSDIVDKIAKSTKEKTLVVWESGWVVYASVSPGTQEDPTPHGKVFGGKVDRGYISIYKDHQKIDWEGVAKVVSATSKSLGVNATPKQLTIQETPTGK